MIQHGVLKVFKSVFVCLTEIAFGVAQKLTLHLSLINLFECMLNSSILRLINLQRHLKVYLKQRHLLESRIII